jgi:acyl-CoA thioesterase FadM
MHRDISEPLPGGLAPSLENTPNTPLTYEHRVRVAFCHTGAEGNVRHDEYARLFGETRELFGIDYLPRFRDEVGREFLLKTKTAAYEYRQDFFFGDTICVRMWVSRVGGASFQLEAAYVHEGTGAVHATGSQHIVYTDMLGKPRRLPGHYRQVLDFATVITPTAEGKAANRTRIKGATALTATGEGEG